LQDAKDADAVLKPYESAKESVVIFEIDGDDVSYHEADVDPKGVAYSNSLELKNILSDREVEFEETWESILEEFNNSGRLRSAPAFIDWLNSNYNVPTRKQQ